MKIRDVLDTLKRLVRMLPPKRRRQLVGVFALLVAAAWAEVLSIGALLPFLALISGGADGLAGSRRIRQALAAIAGEGNVTLALTVAFAVAAIGAALVRVLLNYVLAKFTYRVGHEMGADIYRRALHQPYEYHAATNTSELIAGITEVDTVVAVVLPWLIGVSSGVMAIFILGMILIANPVMAVLVMVGLGGVYAAISVATRGRLLENGRTISGSSAIRLQAVQEGLGGIREVLLDQAQGVYVRRFEEIDWRLRVAQRSNQIIGPTPRYIVEATGMILIAALGYYYATFSTGLVAALPALGVLVVGAQRLMPLLQQVFHGWVMVTGHLGVIQKVLRLCEAPVRMESGEVQPVPFRSSISLSSVSFAYRGSKTPAVQDVSLEIRKGSRVGLVGPTGSGKSTLLDILMGLLAPGAGVVQVDGLVLDERSRLGWQRNVAHVPQRIYLADASIAENVAFGVPRADIDLERVRTALRQAQLMDVVEALPEGLETFVGENGIRLSGGQRQRLGIARALYKRATVLVLDEATSALDNETEAKVMESIEELSRDITMIMIAHRLDSLRSCDVLLRIEDGRLVGQSRGAERNSAEGGR